jgi:hypothetical protein
LFRGTPAIIPTAVGELVAPPFAAALAGAFDGLLALASRANLLGARHLGLHANMNISRRLFFLTNYKPIPRFSKDGFGY